MKIIQLPMTDENVEKIVAGTKWTTLRSPRAAQIIGLQAGESGIWKMRGIDKIVTCIGLVTCQEAGGPVKLRISEGLGDGAPMFKQTLDWLNGYGKLYLYSIKLEPRSQDASSK